MNKRIALTRSLSRMPSICGCGKAPAPGEQAAQAPARVRSIAQWLNSPEAPPKFTDPWLCADRKQVEP